ncbi:MAG: hypothetical protein AAF581_14755 [Planctomycetota bacterium]
MEQDGKDLALILVHAARGGARALMDKYGVKSFPTVVFTDSEGSETARLAGRDEDSVARQFEEHAKKYTRVTPWLESIDKAVAAGKEANKPVLVFAVDPRHPASAFIETFFAHNISYKTVEKFAISKVAFSKKDKQLKGLKIRKGATVYYLDPNDETLRARKVSASDPAKFKKQLDKLLEKYAEKVEKAAKAG